MSMQKKSPYPSFAKIFALVMAVLLISCALKYFGWMNVHNSAERQINNYVVAHGYSMSDYPDEIIELLEKNEETRDFVLNYPSYSRNYDKSVVVDLSEYKEAAQVPMFMQWDKRWGYMRYNGSVMGIKGSAPTCLSMAAIYLLGDVSISPVKVANISIQNNWESKPEAVISLGARNFGITATQIPLSKTSLQEEISSGKILAAVTDGKLVSNTVIIYGYEEGSGFMINDPMSKSVSAKRYDYSELGRHLKKIWAYSK